LLHLVFIMEMRLLAICIREIGQINVMMQIDLQEGTTFNSLLARAK